MYPARLMKDPIMKQGCLNDFEGDQGQLKSEGTNPLNLTPPPPHSCSENFKNVTRTVRNYEFHKT